MKQEGLTDLNQFNEVKTDKSQVPAKELAIILETYISEDFFVFDLDFGNRAV